MYEHINIKRRQNYRKTFINVGLCKKETKMKPCAFYKHIDGRNTVIPFHSNKNIARPLFKKDIKRSAIRHRRI